jgi:penicillin-binding protein 2
MRIKISMQIIRLAVLGIFFLLIYFVVLAKLWDVQIKEGEEHRQSISRQSIRRIRHPGHRGRIYSSDNHLLADNAPSYDIVFHLAEMRQPGKRSRTVKYILESANRMAKAIKRKNTLTSDAIIKHMNYQPGLGMTVFKGLNSEELASAVELSPPIQGTEITTTPTRVYPEGTAACHTIGYVGREDPQKEADRKDYFYYVPGQKGSSGAEKKFNKILKGRSGNSIVRVDHLGYIHEALESSEPRHGNDIILTLNWKAQQIAEKLMKGKNGAFVLLNAKNGEVLAIVSSPGYNLKSFVPQLSLDTWKKLQTAPLKPLLNRATSGAYTPGSIMKPIVAMALLENGVNYADKIHCDGKTYIGNARIKCWSWRKGGHGDVNLIDAIKVSCNDYFIENGSRLGLEKIAETMKSAGIGQKTGFDLPENDGALPSREKKRKIFGTTWNTYDTGILSIGQGIVLVTPLQAAVYTAALANGGTIWRPFILKEIKSQNGEILEQAKPEKRGELKVSPANLRIVRNGMWQAVNASDGSAKTAKNDYITLFGKTGTAEVGSRSNRYTNTWFIAFGKYKKKLYSIVVFVEKGASGGRTCAPIVKNFFNEWLKKEEEKPVGQK